MQYSAHCAHCCNRHCVLCIALCTVHCTLCNLLDRVCCNRAPCQLSFDRNLSLFCPAWPKPQSSSDIKLQVDLFATVQCKKRSSFCQERRMQLQRGSYMVVCCPLNLFQLLALAKKLAPVAFADFLRQKKTIRLDCSDVLLEQVCKTSVEDQERQLC